MRFMKLNKIKISIKNSKGKNCLSHDDDDDDDDNKDIDDNGIFFLELKKNGLIRKLR